jgi:MFS family permease
MNSWRGLIRFMIVRLYVCLLPLYPNNFRSTFNDEIQDIFLKIVIEAEEQGGFGLLKTSMRELNSLVASIIKERWHELKSLKEEVMTPEENVPDAAASGGGGALSVEVIGMPGWKWIPMWTVLMAATIPAALILMAPLTALLLLILNLGVNTGILSSFNDDQLHLVGFFISLSLTLATTQWLLLRNYLRSAWTWFVATAGGLLLGGLLGTLGIALPSNVNLDPRLGMLALLLLIGFAVGFAQWLVIRKTVLNSFWIVAIDVAAACSLLLAGRSITNPIELLIIPMLPGLITGFGLWYLLRESQTEPAREAVETPKATGRRSSRIAWIGLGLVALVPMFFLCIWIYATSQLTLAKNEGIYATPQEAVIAKNSQDWGGAKVVRLEDVRASPNSGNGIQPHVWFGTATVYLDRIPQGRDRAQYSSGSLFIHVKEGWVHVPEGAFPGFIGWVMELYGLEGVNEWLAEN